MQIRSLVIQILKRSHPVFTDRKVIDDFLNILRKEQSEEICSKVIEFISNFLLSSEFYEYIVGQCIKMFEESDSTQMTTMKLLANLIENEDNTTIQNVVRKLLPFFTKFIADKRQKMRHLTAITIVHFSSLVEKKDFSSAFQDLVPQMLAVLQSDLNSGDIEAAKKTIALFIEAIDTRYMFARAPEKVVAAMYQIAKTKELEQSVRILALDFLSQFADTSPSVCRNKIPKFVDTIIPLCMDGVAEATNETLFDEEQQSDEITLYDASLEVLDRIGLSLGGRVIAPVTMRMIGKYMQKSDWRSKVAGTMAIATAGESCHAQFLPQLGSIIDTLLQQLNHESPRLRFATVHCVGQLCNDFTEIHVEYGGKILPAIIASLDDSNQSVKVHAVNCVINVMEQCPVSFYDFYKLKSNRKRYQHLT
jgi:hypothetical protein